MGVEILSLDPGDLPSFSRVGKNYSNDEGTQSIRKHSVREQKLKRRGRSDPSYVSLAETPPILHGYSMDLSRQKAVCSSPRIQHGTERGGGRGGEDDSSRFQRVIRWDDVRGGESHGQPGGHRSSSGGLGGSFAGKGLSRDTREPKVTVTHKQARDAEPYSSFVAVPREKSAFNLRAKHADLAPPPGHYDASLFLVRPREKILGYIRQEEKPNAPTTQAERLSLSSKLKTDSISHGKAFTPRSSFKMLRSRENDGDSAMDSTQLKSLEQEQSQETAEPSADVEEEDALLLTKTNFTTSSKRDTTHMEESSVLAEWPTQHGPFVDMNRMLPRMYGERSTVTGRLSEAARSSPDVWYESSCGTLDAMKRHIRTPDLSRSGKDFDDQLAKLGHVQPEVAAASPVYPNARAALDWTKPKQGWFGLVKKHTNNVLVNMSKSLPRRLPTKSKNGDDIRIASTEAFGKPKNSVCPNEKDPYFVHTPSVNMILSSSSHQALFDYKSPCDPKVPYKVSHRLLLSRSQSVIPFHKALARRPLTADNFTGKPVHEVLDKVYAPEPCLEKTRPRSLSPADFRRPGREAWGGHVPASAAHGLHGTTYWTNVGPSTEIQAGLQQKRLPSLAKTPGREGHVNSDMTKEMMAMSRELDREVREPYSTSGKLYYQHGRATGAVWNPKDNVLSRHVHTPNLDANERAVDAERQRKTGVSEARDLAYEYDIGVIKPRPRAALIHKNPMKA